LIRSSKVFRRLPKNYVKNAGLTPGFFYGAPPRLRGRCGGHRRLCLATNCGNKSRQILLPRLNILGIKPGARLPPFGAIRCRFFSIVFQHSYSFENAGAEKLGFLEKSFEKSLISLRFFRKSGCFEGSNGEAIPFSSP
jgi:hypothetical protein